MKNKVLKGIGLIGLFIIILIGCFVTFSNIRSMNFLDAVKSISEMETGNVKFKLSKNSDGSIVNFIYNFNFNKDFSDDKIENAFATDGTFGIEIEDMEMGLYAPLKLTASDDVDLYIEIDESYEDVFGIPGGENIHASLTSVRKNLGVNIEYSELKKDTTSLKKDFMSYLKGLNKNFEFHKSDNQGITTGVIGRLSGTLTEENIVDLYKVFTNSLDDETIKKYYIDNLYDYLLKNFKNAVIYIDIYGGVVNKISIIGTTDSLVVEISNVNNSNTINIPKTGYIELVDYLEQGASEILELFGFEIEVTLTKVNYLKSSFADFATYMIACIDYSDKSNFEYAEVCISNMQAIINDMKGKIFDKSDTSIDNATYNKYIEFFEEILNYCTLYEKSYKDSTVIKETQLQESIDRLTEISKQLDIDISGVFDKE